MILPILPLYAQNEFNMSPQTITLLATAVFAAQFIAGVTVMHPPRHVASAASSKQSHLFGAKKEPTAPQWAPLNNTTAHLDRGYPAAPRPGPFPFPAALV